MHDLHLADQILKKITEEAKKRNLKKIYKVVIELGQILEHEETVKVENLKFNVEALSQSSPFQGMKIEVVPISESGIYRIKEIVGE